MEQLTFTLDENLSASQMHEQVLASDIYQRAKSRLMLVFEPSTNHEAIRQHMHELVAALPEVEAVGITTLGPLNPDVWAPTHPVCTFLLFEQSEIHIDVFDCDTTEIVDAGYDFAEQLSRYDNARGVLCISSCARMCPMPFITQVSVAHPDIPLFGAKAGTEVLTDDHSCVFTAANIYDRGIITITFCGNDLHIATDYNLGWRPIGKELMVTGYDGNGFVSTIDNKPAASIYRRYLNVMPDKHFFHNVCTFPLVTQSGHRLVARVPLGSTLDGMLQFSTTVEKGERMHLSYTKPEYLLHGSLASANAMASIAPDALLLFTCQNRRVFLGNNDADRELSYYGDACKSMAYAYGYGEILRTSGSGGVLNSSIVAVAFREGEISRAVSQINDPHLHTTKSYIPLSERLVTFLEATTSELSDTIDELATLAERDQLTGIYNRRRMDELIRYELSKRRHNDDLVLLMYDIDFFKRVNDTYGHDTGDIVLKDLTKCVHGVIREADTLGRWGGEEFLCLLTNTSLSQARMVAERIRRRVEQTDFLHVGKVTISIGITAAETGDTPETLFSRVDKALYDAKHSGRNCVAVR